jgi:Fic family protein
MELMKIERPNLDDLKIEKAWEKIKNQDELRDFVAATASPKYLYWDKVKYKSRPKYLSPEEFWLIVKLFRNLSPTRGKTVIRNESGQHFSLQSLFGQEYFLHDVDMRLGGTLASLGVDGEQERSRFITRGVMEEAIASSQLEGAATTRKVAKQMLREKRRPKTQSEKMILNNYNTMLAIESEYKDSKLSKEILFDIHSLMTADTIRNDCVARFRRDSDNIHVCWSNGTTLYVPPPEKRLLEEVERFIEYANDDLKEQFFVHPVVKASLIHFWVGFLHPFTDGNGRVARALFYWYLLRHDYWAFSYLPLSKIIKKAPVQYRDAFLYSEQDDLDVTYFVDFSLRKIKQAKDDFQKYVREQAVANRAMSQIARREYRLNDRQIQLLRYLHKNPGESTTIRTYGTINNVSYLTSRNDLANLEVLGFVDSIRVGREKNFTGTDRIERLFS